MDAPLEMGQGLTRGRVEFEFTPEDAGAMDSMKVWTTFDDEPTCEHNWRFMRSESPVSVMRPVIGPVTIACKDGRERTYKNRVIFKDVLVVHDTFYCTRCLAYKRVPAP